MKKALLSAFLGAEGVLYAVFLTLDLSGHGDKTIWLKYAGVLLCLLCALVFALRGGDRLVAPALLFTVGADWFLLVRNSHFSLGIALFLVVQFLYLLRLRRSGLSPHLPLRAGLALVLGAAVFLLNIATPQNLLAALYFSQLLSNAILAWLAKKSPFAAGLTLFVCCDICVGLFNLGLALPFSAVAMWLFYLPSQVLIALSAKEAYHEAK